MTKSDCIHIGEYQDMGARMCVCDLVAPLIQEPRCDSCAFYIKTPMLSYEQILEYCKERDLTLIPKDTLRKLQTKSKRDFEVVVNEACLNCELDCIEVVRCHDCRNYEEAKNSCNGMCKEWNTATYTWDYCSRGEKKDEND